MSQPPFSRYQPLVLRVWHWLDALMIAGLLGTVLLRKTFLSWRTNAAFIQDELEQNAVAITPELAKEIAVGIRDPMWDWHYVFGFTLVSLLVLRLLIAIALPAERPFAAVVRAARAMLGAAPDQKPEAAHHAIVRLGYAAFYLCVLFMATSGPVMYFKAALGLDKGLADSIKEAHELMMWFFVVFAAGHILGVVVQELRSGAGIVSDMIHGGKRG